MNYQWNWGLLFTQPYADWLLSGLGWTLALALTAWLFAVPIGLCVGIARVSTSRSLFWVAQFYVSVFRNIPLLLQMFAWFFMVPELLPTRIGLWFKRDLSDPEFWTAVLALALYTSGRLGELFRAGLQAVPRGQRMASAAAGMTEIQTLRYVVVPQAFRIVLPPLRSEFLSIVKNSSLALTIGVLELTAQSRQIENFTFHALRLSARRLRSMSRSRSSSMALWPDCSVLRALALDPQIMLFDEPTSALDPEMINEVLEVMTALALEGMTMMVVTHEMGFARKVADRMIFMDQGELVQDCPTGDFFDRSNNRSERLQLFLNKVLSH